MTNDDFIAVIDGSTSKASHRLSRWQSNGRLCMKTIANYISHAPASITADRFCKGVTDAVARHYDKRQMPLYTLHPEERLTASCIVFSRLQRQIWMIGDCQCLLWLSDKSPSAATRYDNPKPYEERLAHTRADILRHLIHEGKTQEELLLHDVGRDAIIPSMIEEMKNQNITYSVVDGFPIPLLKVRILTLDFHPWTIVLASDGYPCLLPTLADSEQALARQRSTDPLNIDSFVATKAFLPGNNSFDDRSYIKFCV